MAFLFVVGVYCLVGLGILWLIERFRVMQWRFFEGGAAMGVVPRTRFGRKVEALDHTLRLPMLIGGGSRSGDAPKAG